VPDESRSALRGDKSVEREARVLAVCLSPGGIPKRPTEGAEARTEGLVGDGHDHETHRKDTRAISLQDDELLEELRKEGYEVSWGSMGENLTVRGLRVQDLSPGTRLRFTGGLEIELTEVRRPCFVLDSIHPSLKEDVVGRCGYLARVVRPAAVRPGERISIGSRPLTG
jgi:MOSC domain-containing protein YiiM